MGKQDSNNGYITDLSDLYKWIEYTMSGKPRYRSKREMEIIGENYHKRMSTARTEWS